MSLIIGFSVRDGIVVAADRCTTCHENNTTAHSFDSRKIVLLNERTAILHCGDYFVSPDISTAEFLESCADLVNEETEITALPLAILLRYNAMKYKSSNNFIVCGFDKENNGVIYKINVKRNTVEEACGNKIFGCTWDGVANVAAPIIRQTAYDRVSIKDAAALCKLAIEATGQSQYYRGVEITVGREADVYIMHRNGKCTWFSGDAGLLN